MTVLTKRKMLFGNRQIAAISIVLFIIITVAVVFSGSHITSCIKREANAQKNRFELRKLGEQLANASDYLTEEARQYSMTGDPENLYNYWNEIIYIKSRDDAVEKLSSYKPPEKEKNLLSNAKLYSDTLIETETLSMKLMLSGKNINADDYSYDKKLCMFIKKVSEYQLPPEYSELSSEDKIKKSSEILYDYFYAQSKTMIMTPIDEFQEEMNNRLDNDVWNAEEGIRTASFIQKICSLSAVILIVIIILLLEILYIKPLEQYTNVLENKKHDNISELRVFPKGAYELSRFGEVFNQLALELENELLKRERAEQQMSLAKAQAEKANNAKSEFLAQMNHELRTPLNTITGCLYLLENTELDEKQSEYCRSIETSSENLLDLINNVLDFSKIESGYMEFEKADYNFYELIEDTMRVMKVNALNKNISLTTDIDDGIPKYVKGDSLRMKQVLINLIGNALKFTDCGSVSLTIKVTEKYNDKVTAEFQVKDTGIGISPENCEKIFEPFVQSDAGVTRKYGGTGLGLPISNMIVKNASKGRFSITAMPCTEGGSVFTFCAYLYYGKKTETAVNNKKTESINSNALILLVDDNDINLRIEKQILESYGLRVLTAADGYEAIRLAGENKFSLIFLDMHMPGIDGFETAKQLRKNINYSYTPIIALTADAVNGIEERVREAEMNDYLSKPFKPEKLRKIISEYLDIIKEKPESLITESGKLFDINSCIDNLSNDIKTLNELINSFICVHGNSGEYIESHIRNGHYANARHILHDIKGISGNLCCNKLCICAETLLKELHECKADSLDEFMRVLNSTIERLKTYLDTAQTQLSHTSHTNFETTFKVFIELCRNYDISAVDCFNDNRKLFKDNMKKASFNNLEELVRKYDFKAICTEYDRRNENV